MNHKHYLLRRLTSDLNKVLHKALNLMTPYDLFKDWLSREKIKITKAKFDKINRFVELLIRKNLSLNLTRIVSEEEVWVKHIFDSLVASRYLEFREGMTVMDLGTGGGLPGIPLAILHPSVRFILVDSTHKKIEAVEEFVRELKLRNVKTVCARAEDLGHDPAYRENMDMIVTRAVAPLRVLVELCIPLIPPYGKVAAYKGPDYIEELADSKNAVTKLKAESPRIYHYSLPADMGKRTLILMTKKEHCPDTYPRRAGMPEKRPL